MTNCTLTGNFTNAPMFVAAANSNFMLTASSPARNTGNNADAPSGPDLAGNPRIVHGYVDMGAYEYQGGAGQGDFDGEGEGNGDEGVAGTDFTDPNDLFEAASLTLDGVTFLTETGRVYAVDYTEGLVSEPQVWTALTTNISGTGAALVIEDPSIASSGPSRSYRVGLDLWENGVSLRCHE